KERQSVLEATNIIDRFEKLSCALADEIEIIRFKKELNNKVKTRVDKNQKDYIMREQIKAMREELGEGPSEDDAEVYIKKMNNLVAPDYVKERLEKEIKRFKSVMGSPSESAVSRGYIETLLDLPWDKRSKDNNSLKRAEKILNRDHYGLEKVKERILEFLAVSFLNDEGQTPIICLVGPPGTGKTSIAKSVAEALEKEYVRISLGGVRDEAEIRGHRKTYIGAMPGRLVQGLKKCGTSNPLMLLDEIDKVGQDYKGDTSASILEVLDSEQNKNFVDHYGEIPVDLSDVMFICTANSTQGISKPLLDRMELIEVNSYTANEKLHIAKEHLLPKQLEKNGLTPKELEITKGALRELINSYTREAGVRLLERKIGELCRKVAKQYVEERKEKVFKLCERVSKYSNSEGEYTLAYSKDKESEPFENPPKITEKNIEKYLGKKKYRKDKINEIDEVGTVRGLAWTEAGGDTLTIETAVMPGKGELILTGNLGDVMKESARIAISYVRSVPEQTKAEDDFFSKHDIHIHVPEGAVPKDGPSAGITMATSVFSAVAKIPVSKTVAMTGELSLRGHVMPIGGLKEKLLAAKTAGVKKVLVPLENKSDVSEISEEITKGLEIVFVSMMDEVLKEALVKSKR
nr:endopeptidase La [Lachnospiraceae bacterium]